MLGKPPQNKGPLAGITIDEGAMVEEYIRAMDWDSATAKPSSKRLKELGLGDIAGAIQA